VGWTSNNTSVATVVTGDVGTPPNNGLVYGAGVGGASITATLGGLSGSITVSVTAATVVSIAITPANPSIAQGLNLQLTATGTFSDGSMQNITTLVTWSSSNPSVAPVSENSGTAGQVTGLAVGSATITAELNGVPPATTTVTVTALTISQIIISTVFPPPQPFPPPNPTFHFATGQKQFMVASALFTDGTTLQNVTQPPTVWLSSDPTVADILSTGSSQTNGRLDAKKPGTTTLTATVQLLGGGTMTGTATVIVP
jgi:uncharacterized protein YjdB